MGIKHCHFLEKIKPSCVARNVFSARLIVRRYIVVPHLFYIYFKLRLFLAGNIIIASSEHML